MQDWADDAVHVAPLAPRRPGRHGQHTAVTFGGDLVRLVDTVEYAGPGGDAELFGLYFADAGQHLEHRLFVDHAVPHCHSDVAYKGALQGEGAHTVWIGDVLIRKAAEGTDTYEMNRNLVLTDGARADSVPNLEIETGEIVGAGHASATGRFDDEQLFYLLSAGHPEAEARRLVVRGFFADCQRIGVPELEDAIGMTRVACAVAASRAAPRRPAEVEAARCSSTRGEVARREVFAIRDVCRTPTCRCPRARSTTTRGVLAARLPLRPAHRQAHRAAGHRAGTRQVTATTSTATTTYS